MKLQDIIKLDPQCTVLKDCLFDTFGLVGKKYGQNEKVVTFLANLEYVDSFLESNMVGVICTKDIAGALLEKYRGGICIATNPKSLFFQFHNSLVNEDGCYGPEINTEVDYSARIDAKAIIAEKNVTIGANVNIGPNTVIHEGVTIEDNVIIQAGCVIGAPAFYYFNLYESKILVKSVGKVVLKKNVEIHSNVIIEKGVLNGETFVGSNTKIACGSIIEHNCYIDRNCTICAGVKFAGGVSIGENTFIGVSTSVAPNIKIGANAKISIGSVITKNIDDGMEASGNFAIEHNKYIKFIKSIR